MATVEAVAVAPPRAAGVWRLAWGRLRRDRLALVSLAALAFVVFAVFAGAPIASALVGHGPNDIFPYAANDLKPVGPWTHVPNTHSVDSLDPDAPLPTKYGQTLMVLGADSVLGRDEMLRVLYGGQVSLEVALGATLLAGLIGALLGTTAAFFGGFVDSVISRFVDLVMAFPLLLFLVMIGSTSANDRFAQVTLHGALPAGVLSLVVVIGLFTWFYPARIVRTEILALRRREFVEAATATGASSSWIMRKHLLPHLGPSLLVWGSVAVATNIMLEAGVSFLGAGIKIPTSSWGTLLASTWGTVSDPTGYNADTFTLWPTILPTIAISVTVIAFNQFAESLRQVLDPRSTA
jgi:peptide/nickel transport system permease protein